MPTDYLRPFLKWPGGKYRLLDRILPMLPKRDAPFVEPFVGAGSVFLNTRYDHCILNDSNPDIIALYKIIKEDGKAFVAYCRTLFDGNHNTEASYYALRDQFNEATDPHIRSALFIYLNRHGYNGLCRYNSSHKFNVPFGRYVRVYFPEQELLAFHQRAQTCEFTCQDFTACIESLPETAVVYCDPPYVPLSKSAHFTQYGSAMFEESQQSRLAELAQAGAQKGQFFLLSNHDTPFTRKAYHNAKIESFSVRRFISCQSANRKPVNELLAEFS